jgi:four helix bundle protein
MSSGNLILDLSEALALGIMDFADVLADERQYIFANQLLRSGTSIGAMIQEAQSPDSRADFIHKCKIAHKEALETSYWLRLCRKSSRYPTPPLELEKLSQSTIRVLDKILNTSRSNAVQ